MSVFSRPFLFSRCIFTLAVKAVKACCEWDTSGVVTFVHELLNVTLWWQAQAVVRIMEAVQWM
jgi:hypothetical protein